MIYDVFTFNQVAEEDEPTSKLLTTVMTNIFIKRLSIIFPQPKICILVLLYEMILLLFLRDDLRLFYEMILGSVTRKPSDLLEEDGFFRGRPRGYL